MPADGDTTEEDVPEPPPRRKQLRRVHSPTHASESDTDRPVKSRRGHPRVGRFDLDTPNSQPIAVVHPRTGKMIIFTPEKSRDFDLAPESFRGVQFFLPPNTTQSSPIFSHSASLMMGAMFSSNTFGDLMNSHPYGPVEAFYPLPNSDTAAGDESDFSGLFDDDDEEEGKLNIEDFVAFGEDESDEEAQTTSGGASPWHEGDIDDVAASSPCRRPSTALSASSDAQMEIHPLLTHFDNNSDAVGAFRRNQVNQQLI